MNFYDIKNRVFDDLGNVKQEFEVVVYNKLSNGEWVEDRRFESGASYFVVDGQLYNRIGNDSMIKLNMDFNNENCGACYQVGELVKGRKKITENEILFKHILSKENQVGYTLHKQSYSDGTCFYTLQDMYGKWDSQHASHDLKDILEQLEIESQRIEKDSQLACNMDNKAIQDIYRNLSQWYFDMINDIKSILNIKALT